MSSFAFPQNWYSSPVDGTFTSGESQNQSQTQASQLSQPRFAQFESILTTQRFNRIEWLISDCYKKLDAKLARQDEAIREIVSAVSRIEEQLSRYPSYLPPASDASPEIFDSYDKHFDAAFLNEDDGCASMLKSDDVGDDLGDEVGVAEYLSSLKRRRSQTGTGDRDRRVGDVPRLASIQTCFAATRMQKQQAHVREDFLFEDDGVDDT
jgi:hypothetical protein